MEYLRLSVVVLALSGGPALSHEFWIEPQQYQVESGAPLVASLRNGENFSGISLAWFENRFTRFEMISPAGTHPVEGRLGDTPALQTDAPQNGLLVVVHETTPSSLIYTDWEKFLRFAAHKDFATAAADHEKMGWSKERFRESYTRHAKALIAVGDGAGQDRTVGMETEFTALTNPYDADFDGNMRAQITYQGEPRADVQVEVFARAPDGTVAVTLFRSDATGVVVVPVEPGVEYLFDAVVLRPAVEAGSRENAPVWETLWAALTFKVPLP